MRFKVSQCTLPEITPGPPQSSRALKLLTRHPNPVNHYSLPTSLTLTQSLTPTLPDRLTQPPSAPVQPSSSRPYTSPQMSTLSYVPHFLFAAYVSLSSCLMLTNCKSLWIRASAKRVCLSQLQQPSKPQVHKTSSFLMTPKLNYAQEPCHSY